VIEIFHLDEAGRVVEIDYVPAPPASTIPAVQLTPDMSIGDLIYIRPDWPPIGSTDFAERLRLWHAQQQACTV
jgi:hypothetical protein